MSGTTRKRSPGRKGTPLAEPKSKLPQSVSDVLRKHVTLEVECIDRMYLNAIGPRMQGDLSHAGGSFLWGWSPSAACCLQFA